MSDLSPLRTGRITGSRVSAILGLNPYTTRADVLREMVRQHCGASPEFEGNAATEYGVRMEPKALAMYEQQFGLMTYGGGEIILHPDYDFIAVTPDGLVNDDGMVECKAPYRGNYTDFNGAAYYVPQMQLQMACSGRDWCDFVVLQRDEQIYVSRLERDRKWLTSVMPQLEAFILDFHAACKDPEKHLGDLERKDTAWRKAAKAYQSANAKLKAAQAVVDSAKATLIELAGDASAKGCGVQVIRADRSGSISYANAVRDLLPDADLSPYMGKPTTYFTIKEQA